MKKLLFLLIVSALASCKKDDNANKGRLDFSFNSIYEINEIKIAVFQGWVNATSTDLDEGSKNYYAVHKSQDPKFNILLDPGPYTITVHYKDFNVIYNEKIDLVAGNNPVALSYNRYLTPEIKLNGVIYSTNDDAYLSFRGGATMLGEGSQLGITSVLKLNGSQLQASSTAYAGGYNFKISNLKNGENTIEGIIKFKNGEERTLTAKILAFDKNTVENIWENVTQNYLEQEIFRRFHYSLENDTIVGSNTSYKNTVIEGLYGEYKFDFQNNALSTIEVIHGNLNLQADLTLGEVKAKLDNVFGQPVRVSEENYNYTINNYRINLSVNRPSANIISTITKIK